MFRISEKKINEMCDKFGFFLKQTSKNDLNYWRIMCTSPVFPPDTWPGLKNCGHTNSFCVLYYDSANKEFRIDPEDDDMRFASYIYPESIKEGKLYFKFDRRSIDEYLYDEQILANKKYYDQYIIKLKQDVPTNTLELYNYLKECREVLDKTLLNQKQYLIDARKNSFKGDFE